MNGHDEEGIRAYGPDDEVWAEMERRDDEDWFAWLARLDAPEPEGIVCLDCQDPPLLDEIEYGQLVCPDCGMDWFCRGYYDECRAEMHWDGSERRYVVNEV